MSVLFDGQSGWSSDLMTLQNFVVPACLSQYFSSIIFWAH